MTVIPSGINQNMLKEKMGLIANLVVANLSDAKAIEQSVNPSDTWEGFDASGLDPAKLDTLQSLVHEESGSDDPNTEFVLLGDGEARGCWVSPKGLQPH